MGDIRGFMKYERELPSNRKVEERVLDWNEIFDNHPKDAVFKQSARCMDCGVPFCHSGCPLGNLIPQFNEAVFNDQWFTAYQILSSTNNFPEFTGRICPAPCEGSCVLGIHQNPVTIEWIEKNIAEKAFESGWIQPVVRERNGKKIAIIGSGPAGLAAADELNKAGYQVTVYERNDRPGGLLRYGIPDFKLEKSIVERRIQIMQESGIVFHTQAYVGINVDASDLLNENDALLLAGGSTIARDMNIEGREGTGVYFAMEFLEENNRLVAGDSIERKILVKNKRVVVIGGGDTGSDCIGTSNRLGATDVVQLEILPKPSLDRKEDNPWPQWPFILRTSTSHEEGCQREWNVITKRFVRDEQGELRGIEVAEVEWNVDIHSGKSKFMEVDGTTRILECDIVFLAIGFLHTEHGKMLSDLGVEWDQAGNIKTNHFVTSNPKVFAAGDARRGQSLVVWAIQEGREAAFTMDKFLGDNLKDGKTKKSIFKGENIFSV